jgi:hypothetical protein
MGKCCQSEWLKTLSVLLLIHAVCCDCCRAGAASGLGQLDNLTADYKDAIQAAKTLDEVKVCGMHFSDFPIDVPA